MSTCSSLDSMISVEPYTESLDSRISVDEYDDCVALSSMDEDPLETQQVRDAPGSSSVVTPICFKRIPRRVSSKRFQYLTSEHQLRIDSVKKCCLSDCLVKFGKKELHSVRLYYFSLNGEEQDTFLAARLQLLQDSSSRAKVCFEYFLNMNDRCCHKAFKIAFGVGNMRLNRIQQQCYFGNSISETPVEELTTKGLVGQHAIKWLQNYFRLHCEVMPTTGRLHLSDNYTREELFQIYKDDLQSKGERFIKYCQFTRLWKLKFDNVLIPRKVRMGVCAVCANLKSMIKATSVDDAQKEKYKAALTDHRNSQANERIKAMHHRDKALKSPGRYMCLMIDGMDQKKTCLPHFSRIPKDITDECLVQMHLVGCLSYHRVVKPWVFFTYPNVHNDPNLTITIIHRVLQSWTSALLEVLYVQLDNTARENKNSSVFGYLSMLVHQGLFKKIKVNFLLVGHTHDHIDQMFSTFSKKLSRYDAFTLPIMSTLIQEAYTPKPEVVHLKDVYDFKRYAFGGNVKVFGQLHNISFNHVFFIKWDELKSTALLYAKQHSSSQWEPECAYQFLLQMPTSLVVYGVEQMPYEDKKNDRHVV